MIMVDALYHEFASPLDEYTHTGRSDPTRLRREVHTCRAFIRIATSSFDARRGILETATFLPQITIKI